MKRVLETHDDMSQQILKPFVAIFTLILQKFLIPDFIICLILTSKN